MSPRLSKSRFVAGHQCPLRLWNQCFHPELATPPDADTQARFDAGNDVGEVARGRFPGVLVTADYQHPEDALAETARLLADPSVRAIHEAAFLHQGALVRVDSLVRREGAWDVVETKSVVEEKSVHLLDAAFQRWIATNAGLPVGGTFVMRLDRSYRYEGGDLDLTRLFLLDNVSGEAESLADLIAAELTHDQVMLQEAEAPVVEPGRHCLKPYGCPFLAHCTRDWPEVPDPVEWLPRIGETSAIALHAAGTHRMVDLPESDLNAHQLRVRACHQENAPWVGASLAPALSGFAWPVHYLDFETFATPLPMLVGSRPYEPIPVQWSCHRVAEDGRMDHDEFLADGRGDPRDAFALSLLGALGTSGSIVVYSGYEKSILGKLALALPQLEAPIQAVIERLVDLLPIVKAQVYFPAFHGSYSIKKVLPALAPGFGYEHLAVQDGLAAMAGFRQMLEEADPATKRATRADLLAYCAQDTLAMVKVHEALVALSVAPPVA